MMDLVAVDRASECDRLWFEKHPGVECHVRRRYPGELGPAEDDYPAHEYPWVEVVQIRPGLRLREPFRRLEILSMS